MIDCCTEKKKPANKKPAIYPRSHRCPVNGKPYASVRRKTLLHHIAHPWSKALTEQGYYFCSDPLCDVVYFGENNSFISNDDLRDATSENSMKPGELVCYCFGVTRELAHSDKSIKRFVTEQTKKSLCSCETSNPSGRCCLKDFPKS